MESKSECGSRVGTAAGEEVGLGSLIFAHCPLRALAPASINLHYLLRTPSPDIEGSVFHVANTIQSIALTFRELPSVGQDCAGCPETSLLLTGKIALSKLCALPGIIWKMRSSG